MGSALVFSFYFIGGVFAGEANITFPIAELGDCANKDDCRTYCEAEDHKADCIAFAERNGLMSPEEARKAKKFLQVGTGPGGCKDQKSCEEFCNNTSNIKICLDFARQHELLSDQELREAEKIAKHLDRGGKLPGGCTDKKSCEVYCSEGSHIEECLEFGEKSGLIENDELDKARKFLPLMQKGETPGQCKSKEQCEAYCQTDGHFEECTDFALKIGAIKQEDVEIIKKTGGRGPGGCRGQEECRSFCDNPTNQEACLNFAQEHGFLDKNKIEDIRQGTERMRQMHPAESGSSNSIPPRVKECIELVLGPEKTKQMERGEVSMGSEMGQSISQCFRSMEGPMENHKEGLPPASERNEHQQFNPGCRGPEECSKYCSDPAHNEECNIRPGQSGQPEQMPMPYPSREGQYQSQPSFQPQPDGGSGQYPKPYPIGEPSEFVPYPYRSDNPPPPIDQVYPSHENQSAPENYQPAPVETHEQPPAPTSFGGHPYLGAAARYLLKR